MPFLAKWNDEIIPASVLKVFTDVVNNRGGDAREFCKKFGIDLRIAEKEGEYISLAAYVDLLEYSAEQLDIPFLGFHIARLQALDDFGPIVPLIRSAETLRDALHYWATYQPVYVPLVSFSLVQVPGDILELCWTLELSDREERQYRQALELAVGLFMKVLCDLMPSDFRASYVRIAAREPSVKQSKFSPYVDCEVLYGQPITSIGVPVSHLGTKLSTKDKFLVGLMRSHLDKIRIRNDVPLVKQIELMINAMLPFGSCTLKDCARQLGLAPRTLQLRLADEGTDFTVLLEKQRRLLAEGYLRDSQLPLIEIATTLGYSDQATFSRAFKSWTGESPSAFRKSQTGGKRVIDN